MKVSVTQWFTGLPSEPLNHRILILTCATNSKKSGQRSSTYRSQSSYQIILRNQRPLICYRFVPCIDFHVPLWAKGSEGFSLILNDIWFPILISFKSRIDVIAFFGFWCCMILDLVIRTTIIRLPPSLGHRIRVMQSFA